MSIQARGIQGVPADDEALIGTFARAAREHGVDPGVLRGSALQVPLYHEDTGYSARLSYDLRMRLALDSVAHATAHNMKEDTKDMAHDAGMKKDTTEHGHLKVTDLQMVSESCSK